MKWIITIAIALAGVGTSWGMDPQSTGCSTDVSARDITRSVETLVAHLRASTAFQQEAASMAARTIGRVRATNPDLRETILGACASASCQSAYAAEEKAAINRELASLLPQTDNNSLELRNQLSGRSPSKGIALVFHQLTDFLDSTRRALSKLGEVPRLAVADESDPLQQGVLSELTKIHYSRKEFPEDAWQITPSGETFDVYLFGGYFSGRNLVTIAEFFKPLLANDKIKRINFHLFTDSVYLSARFGEPTSYEMLYQVTDFDFRGPARNLVRAFELTENEESLLPNHQYSYLRKSDQKTVTVNFVRPL